MRFFVMSIIFLLFFTGISYASEVTEFLRYFEQISFKEFLIMIFICLLMIVIGFIQRNDEAKILGTLLLLCWIVTTAVAKGSFSFETGEGIVWNPFTRWVLGSIIVSIVATVIIKLLGLRR